jgi:ribosomal protein S18 acetylase RimI-like enzyme
MQCIYPAASPTNTCFASEHSGMYPSFQTSQAHHMNSVTVRQAVLSDLADLASLFNQYREFQGEKTDLAAAQQFLQARFDHGESVVFIAHIGDVVVGLAQLYPSYSSVSLKRVFILNDLYVHEAGRRQGVASKLLAAVETHAWSLGAVRVTLNVGRNNAAGQALYEAQGWSQDAQFLMYHRFPSKP